MTELDETTCEQLSAWMDGALPAAEARFLERRLAHDPALRAKWERMQLASACLRGHEVLPMPGLAERVAAGLDATPSSSSARRPLLGWAIAASLAVLALALVPRLMPSPAATPAPVAAQPAPVAPAAVVTASLLAPNPGSADLVATAPSPVIASEEAVATAPADATASPTDAAIAAVAASPTEFPLADTARPSAWPRAGLPGSDAAMEGYLVRHNEMADAATLGGFVPYLDVVAAGEEEALPAPPADAATPATDGDDRQ
jgi:negative regulator of sigma E activity